MNNFSRTIFWLETHREKILKFNIWIGISAHLILCIINFGKLDERFNLITGLVLFSGASVIGISIFNEVFLCDRLLRANKRILIILSPTVLATFFVLLVTFSLQVFLKKTINWIGLGLLFQTVFTLLGLMLSTIFIPVIVGLALRFVCFSKVTNKWLYSKPKQNDQT